MIRSRQELAREHRTAIRLDDGGYDGCSPASVQKFGNVMRERGL
jgi:hypothetical protein